MRWRVPNTLRATYVLYDVSLRMDYGPGSIEPLRVWMRGDEGAVKGGGTSRQAAPSLETWAHGLVHPHGYVDTR